MSGMEDGVGMDERPDTVAYIGVAPYPHAFPALQTMCNAACQVYDFQFRKTEVLGSVVLDTMKYMRGERDQREYANATLNAHMEIAEEIFDDEDELDKIIANEGRVTSENTNDGNDNYEPVLTGRSPTAAAPAPAANLYTTLLEFVNLLRTNVDFLNNEMSSMNQSLTTLCGLQAQVYNNILFFSTGVGVIRDTSLFPKYSFNILCNKQSFLLPQLLVLGGRGVGSILNTHVCNIVRQLRELATPDSIQFKIVNPTDTNKLWQVKICLFGNEFTFISIQIISMSNNFFTLGFNPYDVDFQLYAISNLCFSLYNKCLSKDFNCLCSLSELDINLFRAISSAENNIVLFTNFIRHFLDNLIETLPNIKKQYFIMGLYNVASCSSYPNYTPETKAYELLFEPVPVGIDLFNKSMCFIKGLNQQTPLDTQGNPVFPEQIRFAMGGGKLYSIFQKALNAFGQSNQENFSANIVSVITGYTQLYPNDRTAQWEQKRQTLNTILNTELLHASVKAAADADFGCFYPEPQEGIAAGGIGASLCMAICMLLQLSLKQLIDGLFAPPPPAVWNTSEIDIGNSCIGTPPSTLSSLRIVLKNIPRFYLINNAAEDHAAAAVDAQARAAVDAQARAAAGAVAAGILEWLQRNFNLGDGITNSIKATISPYDFVMKGSMKSYIFHIFEAVHSYRPLDAMLVAQFNNISDFLTRYCMVTQEGFSSPIKGILDIFYTLFIIENFANRTFVTQKINKELKRVAICAQILFLHYTQLPQIQLTQQILPILTAMIGYGYDGSNLLGIQFVPIMTKYVEFVSVLCTICITDPNYLYFSVAIPGVAIPGVAIPGVTRQINTSIETSFMNLLLPEQPPPPQPPTPQPPPPQPAQPVYCNGVSSVLTQTITKYTDIIQALWTMGAATTALYKNKLYASCRDAENKKEGVVAIMSAYQAFLWDIRKINRIRRNQEGDTCAGKVEGCQGIFQCLLPTLAPSPVFDELTIIINTIVENVDILNLGDGTTVDEYTFTDANARKLFLVFSWFITSVFGVKTKSKSTKVVSIGRTYLQLLRETRVGQGEVSLFGSQITISDAAVAAAPAVINGEIVPEVRTGEPVGTATVDELGRLCLAYSSERIFGMAINKYIKMDIDMIVDAARVTAAAAFNLATAQQAAILQASNDVKQVLPFQLVIQQSQPAGEQPQPQPQEQRVMVYPLSVAIASLVFNEEICIQLIANLSHIPTGKGNKENAALYMRTIMRRICFCLDTSQMSKINVSIQAIQGFYPYSFDLHNLTKFKNLTNAMKTQWYNYLMSNILNTELNTNLAHEKIFNIMRLLVLLYNCIVFENDTIRPYIIPANLSSYLDAIGPRIDTQFKECQTGDAGGGLLILSMEWKREEPIEIAAAAGLTAKQRQEKLNAEVEAKAKPKTKSNVKTIGRIVSGPGPRVAELAAMAATIRDAKLKNKRTKVQDGGNTNNHTRRNKNKRKKNSKSKTKTKFKTKSSPKHRKAFPSSRSGSQSNRKKSKPKKSQKNVTFKRRRALK